MADPDMLFDLNVKDADLHDTLARFFELAGRPVAFDDPLDGIVSVRAADLEFNEAISLLLPENYQVVEREGMYHIRRIPRAAA